MSEQGNISDLKKKFEPKKKLGWENGNDQGQKKVTVVSDGKTKPSGPPPKKSINDLP